MVAGDALVQFARVSVFARGAREEECYRWRCKGEVMIEEGGEAATKMEHQMVFWSEMLFEGFASPTITGFTLGGR